MVTIIDSLPVRGMRYDPSVDAFVADDQDALVVFTAELRIREFKLYRQMPSGSWQDIGTQSCANDDEVVAALPPILKCDNCGQYVPVEFEAGRDPWEAHVLFRGSASERVCDSCGVRLMPTTLVPDTDVCFRFGSSNLYMASVARYVPATGELFLKPPVIDIEGETTIEADAVETALGPYRRFWELVDHDDGKLLVVTYVPDNTGRSLETAISIDHLELPMDYPYFVRYSGREYRVHRLPNGVHPVMKIVKKSTAAR